MTRLPLRSFNAVISGRAEQKCSVVWLLHKAFFVIFVVNSFLASFAFSAANFPIRRFSLRHLTVIGRHVNVDPFSGLK